MAFVFIKDREPIYETEQYDVVLVGVSTHNLLNGNYQVKIGVKYPIVEKIYDMTPYADLRKLGKRLTFENLGEGKPIISLMFMCRSVREKGSYIDYEALEKCLTTANAEFKGKRIMTTIIGSTKFDGDGDRNKCLEIMEKCLTDVEVYVYDYEQISIKEEIKRQNKYFSKIRAQDRLNRTRQKEITEKLFELRKRTYLPTDKYLPTSKKKQCDTIFNI